MGQKTNPNIFRLGKVKEWKTKYVEKKTTESSAAIVRNLEIQKFIYKLFSNNGLYVQNCKTYHSEKSIHVYILYYRSEQSLIFKNKLKKKIKIQQKKKPSKLFKNKVSNITKVIAKKKFYLAKTYGKSFKKNFMQNLLQKQYLLKKKSQRLEAIQTFKKHAESRKYKTFNKQTLNLFIFKALKGISLFTKKKQDISLHLKQINNENIFLQKITKKNKQKIEESVVTLRKFQQNEFFKCGFNILYNFSLNNQNPKLLADFIAFNLKRLKRPNFFLRFMKVALKIFITKNLSSIERIQIKIKGRFNGAPRSTYKFLNIGKNIPVLTLNSKTNYAESTAYTSNGTFGIKIWTYKIN